MYPLAGAREKKFKEIIYPQSFKNMRDLQTDSALFATFTPPGFYNKKDPRATDNTTFPGKHTVAQYLQEVMWNVKSQWNQNGLDGNEISKRCQFFVTTDNISNHCESA